MRRWLLRRIFYIPLSLFVVISLSFGIIHLAPGDPAVVIAGHMASEEDIEDVRAALGLDRPLHEQYVAYVAQLGRGDLGTSYITGRPVLGELMLRLPRTVELVALSLTLAVVLGIAIGAVGSYFRNRATRTGVRLAISATQSVPDFLLGLVLIYVVFFLLGWAPAPVGQLGFSEVRVPRVTGLLFLDSLLAGNLGAFLSALHHAMLPVLALATTYCAYFAKTTRSVLEDELSSAYVEFARACGLSRWSMFKYAFLVGRTRLLTYGAILFGAQVGAVAIIEIVFSWRGAASWALEGMLALDLPVIQGFILFTGLITLVTYLLLDFLVALLDPRVSYV